MRICLGKTFVESTTRLTLPILLSHFDFEFLDGVDPKDFKMPPNNLNSTSIPEQECLITKKIPTYVVRA